MAGDDDLFLGSRSRLSTLFLDRNCVRRAGIRRFLAAGALGAAAVRIDHLGFSFLVPVKDFGAEIDAVAAGDTLFLVHYRDYHNVHLTKLGVPLFKT